MGTILEQEVLVLVTVNSQQCTVVDNVVYP